MYFYLPKLSVNFVCGVEAAHFFSLRVKVGQEVTLTDLNGQIWQVKISFVEKKSQKVAWEVLDRCRVESGLEQVLFQAWPDKSYAEKLMEVLAFSGFTQVYFFSGQYSPKQNLNLNRLEKILVRGCELAERAYKPRLEVLESFDVLKELVEKYRPVVLEKEVGQGVGGVEGGGSCLVGPEGGWGRGELDYFEAQKLSFVSLGRLVYPAWLAGFVWDKGVV